MSPRHTRRERPQQRKVGEKCPVILPKCRLPLTFRDLLYAANRSEGRRAEDFFAFKNPTDSVGFEPANLGTKGQQATSRPPKPLFSVLRTHVKTGYWNSLFWWYECVQHCRELSLAALFVAMVICTNGQRVFIVKTFFESELFASAKNLQTFLLLWLTHSFYNWT
jgi:hypothetical protein